jgi:hypothetical protein
VQGPAAYNRAEEARKQHKAVDNSRLASAVLAADAGLKRVMHNGKECAMVPYDRWLELQHLAKAARKQ